MSGSSGIVVIGRMSEASFPIFSFGFMRCFSLSGVDYAFLLGEFAI